MSVKTLVSNYLDSDHRCDGSAERERESVWISDSASCINWHIGQTTAADGICVCTFSSKTASPTFHSIYTTVPPWQILSQDHTLTRFIASHTLLLNFHLNRLIKHRPTIMSGLRGSPVIYISINELATMKGEIWLLKSYIYTHDLREM